MENISFSCVCAYCTPAHTSFLMLYRGLPRGVLMSLCRSFSIPPVAYGGPQVHTKFKSLTLYSNHSRRIQIAHTKDQIFTPNSKTLAPNSNHPHQKSNLHTEFKNTRTKFKSLTPKIKSSHRIQITHTEFKNTRTKFKSLTLNSNLHTEFKPLTPN